MGDHMGHEQLGAAIEHSPRGVCAGRHQAGVRVCNQRTGPVASKCGVANCLTLIRRTFVRNLNTSIYILGWELFKSCLLYIYMDVVYISYRYLKSLEKVVLFYPWLWQDIRGWWASKSNLLTSEDTAGHLGRGGEFWPDSTFWLRPSGKEVCFGGPSLTESLVAGGIRCFA